MLPISTPTLSNSSISTGEVEKGSGGEVEQWNTGEAGMAGEAEQVEQTRIAKIYGDKIGKDDWTEVELSRATYLGSEVMVIPSVGEMVGMSIEKKWLVFGIPGLLIKFNY